MHWYGALDSNGDTTHLEDQVLQGLLVRLARFFVLAGCERLDLCPRVLEEGLEVLLAGPQHGKTRRVERGGLGAVVLGVSE